MTLTFKNILESLNLEARSNPELNAKETFSSFIGNLLTKVDYQNLYVTFRKSLHVTDINRNNDYETPTGVYSYPVAEYVNSNDIIKVSEYNFRSVFPYQSDLPFMVFMNIKNTSGLLDSETPKATLDEYVKKIDSIYGKIQPVHLTCEQFLTNQYKSHYDLTPKHETHRFWLFLYSISGYINKGGQKQTVITNICNKIGVNGFVDKKGDGYIHPSEPKQAVFFKIKPIADVYVYEKVKTALETKIYTKDEKYFFISSPKNMTTAMVEAATNKLIKKIPAIIDSTRFTNYGYMRVINAENETNIMNEKGNLISPIFYTYMDLPKDSDSIFRVTQGFTSNLMDIKGNLILPKFFDEIKRRADFYLVGTESGYETYNLNGQKQLSNIKNFKTSDFSFQNKATLNNGKQIILNDDGSQPTQQTFDEIEIDNPQEFKGHGQHKWHSLFDVTDNDKGFNLLTDTGELLSPIWSEIPIKFKFSYTKAIRALVVDPKTKLYNQINLEGQLIHDKWADNPNFDGLNEQLNRMKSIMTVTENIQYHGKLNPDDRQWLQIKGRKSYSGGELSPIIIDDTMVGGIHIDKMSGVWGIDYIEIKPEYRNKGILRKIIYDHEHNGVVHFISASPELQQKLTTYGDVTTDPQTDITTLNITK